MDQCALRQPANVPEMLNVFLDYGIDSAGRFWACASNDAQLAKIRQEEPVRCTADGDSPLMPNSLQMVSDLAQVKLTGCEALLLKPKA
jgi:hypothetical protein